MVIYSILNTRAAKRYIGRAKNKQRRWSRHRSELKHHQHYNEHLQRAWDHYGADAFVFEVLEHCTSEEHMWERERWWIAHYQSHIPEKGYNLDLGGKGPKLGTEALAKISAAHKGGKHTPEHCRRISEALKGRTISEESRRKIGDTLRRRYAEGSLVAAVPPPKSGASHPMWGKTHTEEARAKMAAAHLGKTYEERMGAETAARVKRDKSERQRGAANPFYRTFDIAYVKKQIDSGALAATIAAELGISLPTLYKRFRETYGTTINQYKRANLNYQIIDMAAVRFRLEQGELLRDIAQSLNVPYKTLSAHFKQTYGLYPRQYIADWHRRNEGARHYQV